MQEKQEPFIPLDAIKPFAMSEKTCKHAPAQQEVGESYVEWTGDGSSCERERAKAAPEGKQLQAIIGRGCHVETLSLFKI